MLISFFFHVHIYRNGPVGIQTAENVEMSNMFHNPYNIFCDVSISRMAFFIEKSLKCIYALAFLDILYDDWSAMQQLIMILILYTMPSWNMKIFKLISFALIN